MALSRTAAAATLYLMLAASAGAAQTDESPEERAARLARQGAGLSAGIWWVTGIDRTGVDASTWPLLEGYFQRGLDRHLAIESTAGLWRRQETETSSGGPLGGQTTSTRTSYIVPLLTGLKFYPATAPGAAVEPFVAAAVGFAIGVQDADGSTGGLLGGGSGITAQTGFGFRGSAGAEFALTTALGASVAGGYQWLRFGAPVGGADTYKGVRATVGLTYRFQY